jgi:hypothetical protein
MRQVTQWLVVWSGAVVLASAGGVWGQAGLRPSERGPITDINRTLGMGYGAGINRGASSVASLPDQTNTMPRRRGAFPPNPMQPYQSNTSGTSWIGRYQASPWTMRTGGYGYRGGGRIPEYSSTNPGLLLRRPDKTDDQPPDVAIKSSSIGTLTDTLGGTDPVSSQNQLPLDQLVKNYIGGHRESYLNQGWAAFKQGQYRQAGELFSMAEAVSMDDVQARTEVKIAILHASDASSQYAVAINTLKWLLSDDPHTGEIRDAHFLNRLSNVESRYGNKTDYAAHIRELEDVAIANATSFEFKGLRAVVLWTKNDRARAMFYAKDLTTTGKPPWSRLYSLMQASEAEPPIIESNSPASKPAL